MVEALPIKLMIPKVMIMSGKWMKNEFIKAWSIIRIGFNETLVLWILSLYDMMVYLSIVYFAFNRMFDFFLLATKTLYDHCGPKGTIYLWACVYPNEKQKLNKET